MPNQLKLAVAAASVLAGCGGGTTDTGVPSTSQVSLDAATTASAIITSEVSRMVSPSGVALRGSPGSADPTLGCTFDSGNFVCGVTIAGGLAGTTIVTLFTATGTPESAWDSLQTASIQFQTDVAGRTAVGAWDAVVGRHRHLTESGLLGAETTRTWNGGGTDTLQVVDSTGGPTRSYTVFSDVSITDVVAPAAGSDAHWPASGTVVQQLTLQATSGESTGLTFHLQASVTFNGTPIVPLIVGDHSFSLNLATGVVAQTD